MAPCKVLLAAAALALYVAPASSSRVLVDHAIWEEDSQPDDPPEGPAPPLSFQEVDFKFMTDDMRYVEHENGFFDNAKEWLFSDRASSDDVKDELVRGHYCQSRGERSQTNYASSFCYWIPEMQPRGSSEKGLTALLWNVKGKRRGC